MVTDKLRSYSAARKEVLPDVIHDSDKWQNNRAENSHQPTRQRERQMRRFKSPGQAQRFLSAHGAINNLFRCGRHLMRAAHYRLFRDRAFNQWRIAGNANRHPLARCYDLDHDFVATQEPEREG